MKIIGGIAGGTTLEAPEGLAVRPTESRVKESLFDSLGDLRGKTVLDLFAGSGALGLEALSRGAASVFFVEKCAAHARCIEKNLAAVRKVLGEQAGLVQVLKGDVAQLPALLPAMQGRFDVILADPPYAETRTSPYGAPSLAKDQAFAAFAGPAALLVLEHSSDTLIPEFPHSPWDILRSRQYGIRSLSFMKLHAN